MNTKQITTIFVGLLLIAVLSFVVSAKTPDAEKLEVQDANLEMTEENNAAVAAQEKNMTFGQCVSQAAEIKNSCYSTVKETQKTCKETALTQADPKTASKECKKTYKKDLKQCKVDFKAAKKECSKIKHNFLDSIKASFK